MDHHTHAHDRDHDHVDQGRNANRKALSIALAITAVFVVVEVVGGVVFDSLALSADAAHMFSDVVALTVALIAQRIAARPASESHTFGWLRVEVIAAQLNGFLLLGVSVWIGIAAIGRLSDPVDVNAAGLTLIAAGGLAVNLIAMAVLVRTPGRNMNIRAAILHTLGDALGSAGALVAGIAITLGAPSEVDAIASLLIVALVVFAAGRLIFDTMHVLLEGAPRHIDAKDVEAALLEQPHVIRVHHLHLWSLAPGSVALSAHVELEGIDALHDAQAEGNRLKDLLLDRFSIGHSTLELECHPCDPIEAEHG